MCTEKPKCVVSSMNISPTKGSPKKHQISGGRSLAMDSPASDKGKDTQGLEIVPAVQPITTVHRTEVGTPGSVDAGGKVSYTSIHPKLSKSVKYKSVRSDKTLSQPVEGKLPEDLNDYASVPVSKELLAGKVVSENKHDPDVKEGEMNLHRENPQNNIKKPTAFKLHRAQLPLFKPQLFGAFKASMKVPMFTRHKRVIGRRLPIDNFRLNTFNLKLPVSGLN